MSMYSSFPKSDRLRIRIALAGAWAFTALGGLGGIFQTSPQLMLEIGWALPLVSSIAIASAATGATVGVLLDKYWIEWVAAWFTAGGVFAYTAALWYLVAVGSAPRIQSAALLSALLCFYAYRIVACAAHARKQRTVHKLVQSGETGAPGVQ